MLLIYYADNHNTYLSFYLS